MDEQFSPGCAGEGHALGSHQLGPHVVGQRVVVRHLLEDGRASDVLGTVLSWSDTDVVVDRDQPGSGQVGPVRISVARIVTGKPVPPRASVRNRAAAREVEGHVLSLWPDVEVAEVGEWQLRAAAPYAGRLRRRANSALAMGDPGMPVDAAAAQVLEFYGSRRQAPLAQVVTGSDEEAGLLAAGWHQLGSGDAHCQLASVTRVLRTVGSSGTSLPASYAEDGDRITVTLGDGPTATATGRAAVDGDWVGLYDLHVDPDQRRTGLGTALIGELLDWGASFGAMTAWLHVETDNAAAIALYEKVGFVTHHTYGYVTA